MQVIVDGLIFESSPRGGIARHYRELLPRLCELDPSLDLILSVAMRQAKCPPVHPRIRHHSFLPAHRLLRPGRFWGETVWRTREWLQSMRLPNTPETIWHSTYYSLPRHWRGAIIVTIQDMIYERLADRFTSRVDEVVRAQKKRSILAADALIFTSDTTRRDLLDLYQVAPARTHVVPLAHSNHFRVLDHSDMVRPTSKPFLLYVGSRYGYKNFQPMLLAYARWRGQGEADLIVYGRPWSRPELALLQSMGIAKQVHWVGEDDSVLCALYNQAAALVHPSIYEGFGIPLLEAMACGCPVVASRIPSTCEVAGNCPIYFEPDDEGTLHAAFDAVLSEGRNSERTKRGLERARCYSWDKTAEQTLEVFRSVVG